ncbi:MAG: ECF transporter S component [Ruminococcaceae bacterium]|nr:ECF transporter S component [Oscillospiraceae bacterium]
MSNIKTRKLTVTALLAAISIVLSLIGFSIPLMPIFIKLDFSDLPALLAGFAFGPLYAVAVCFIKNILFNIFFGSAGWVGALSNFLLSVLFVTPAAWLYQIKKNRKSALIGSLTGAFSMALVGIFTNYYIVYPMYAVMMSKDGNNGMDIILGMYRAINPAVTDLWSALIYMNFPFTLAKGLINVAFAFLIYKRLSPILHGKSA